MSEDSGVEVLIGNAGSELVSGPTIGFSPGDGLLRIPMRDAGGVDIQSEWSGMGPGQRDAYLAELRNQGYVVPQYADLDSTIAPPIGPVPRQSSNPPAPGAALAQGVVGGSQLSVDQSFWLPLFNGPDQPGPIQLGPVLNPDGGLYRLPVGGSGLGSLDWLRGLLGGGLWNVLWYGALAFAVYKGLSRVPPSRVIGSAAAPALAAGLVMGFAADRARQS